MANRRGTMRRPVPTIIYILLFLAAMAFLLSNSPVNLGPVDFSRSSQNEAAAPAGDADAASGSGQNAVAAAQTEPTATHTPEPTPTATATLDPNPLNRIEIPESFSVEMPESYIEVPMEEWEESSPHLYYSLFFSVIDGVVKYELLHAYNDGLLSTFVTDFISDTFGVFVKHPDPEGVECDRCFALALELSGLTQADLNNSDGDLLSLGYDPTKYDPGLVVKTYVAPVQACLFNELVLLEGFHGHLGATAEEALVRATELLGDSTGSVYCPNFDPSVEDDYLILSRQLER